MMNTSDSSFSFSRTAGLFSLIDTLWPPLMPLKAPGHGQAFEEVSSALEELSPGHHQVCQVLHHKLPLQSTPREAQVQGA